MASHSLLSPDSVRLVGKLGPDALPVVAQVLTQDRALRSEFKTYAVLRGRNATFVASAPLSDLRVILDVVAELHHSHAQLRHGGSSRRRQV